MGLIRIDKMKESAPVILNLIKDTGWSYSYGIVSVMAIIPVITFQCYELWKCRKEGWHKISYHIMGLMALSGNGFWMVSDIFYHDRFRPYVKWVFAISLVFLVLYGFFAYRNAKGEKKAEAQRVMMVSKQTRGLIFMHTKNRLYRRPIVETRVLMARHRNHSQQPKTGSL
jgi:hypothetical protein